MLIFKKQLPKENVTYFEWFLPYIWSLFIGIYIKSSIFALSYTHHLTSSYTAGKDYPYLSINFIYYFTISMLTEDGFDRRLKSLSRKKSYSQPTLSWQQ